MKFVNDVWGRGWGCGKGYECWCGGVRMGEMCEIGVGEGSGGDGLIVGKGNVVVVRNRTGEDEGWGRWVGNVIPDFDKKHPGLTGA